MPKAGIFAKYESSIKLQSGANIYIDKLRYNDIINIKSVQ